MYFVLQIGRKESTAASTVNRNLKGILLINMVKGLVQHMMTNVNKIY